MSWNHRVIKQAYLCYDEYETIFGIHEVYYNEDGSLRNYTTDPVAPIGADMDELRWTLEKMLMALDKPVLTHEDFKFEEDKT